MRPSSNPLVSICVASLRVDDSLVKLMESAKKATTADYEFVIVSNEKSKDAISRLQKKYPIRAFYETKSVGCTAAFNISFKNALGKYIVFVNDDCEFVSKSIDIMLKRLGDSDVMGAFYYTTPDSPTPFVNRIFGLTYANFFCIKSELLKKLEYLDESFIHYGADPDLSMRTWKAGYSVVEVPGAVVIHHELRDSVRKEQFRREADKRFTQKWSDRPDYYDSLDKWRKRDRAVEPVTNKHLRRIIIGASGTAQRGWTPTEQSSLDLLKDTGWGKPDDIDAILAEHVWEHLTIPEATEAAARCFKHLKKGGYLRIAVPDGFHPDQSYRDYVGIGKDGHRWLHTYISLRNLLESVGFRVELLEWWDEHRVFHAKIWDSEQGYIDRSMFDERNKKRLNYTSIILDAYK